MIDSNNISKNLVCFVYYFQGTGVPSYVLYSNIRKADLGKFKYEPSHRNKAAMTEPPIFKKIYTVEILNLSQNLCMTWKSCSRNISYSSKEIFNFLHLGHEKVLCHILDYPWFTDKYFEKFLYKYNFRIFSTFSSIQNQCHK